MSASKLDAVYRSILITKFFTKGWGKPDNLKRIFEFRKVISDREECYKLVAPDYPVTITKEERGSDVHTLEGHFMTPLEPLLPGVVPECARLAHFQVVMPAAWPEAGCKPMCVHLAGTGDHHFWRRRNLMAKPLVKEGIGAIILENPFYGLRKPIDQVRSSLHNVSDIFVMGGCLILETLVLLHWCHRNGLGPLGVTGLSMGGHMASLAATNWPQPLVLVPCLSWSTASAVFTQGVMSNSIDWELLENQFFSDGVYKEQLAKMVTVIDDAFLAGRNFAQRFSMRNQDTGKLNANLPAVLNAVNDSAKMFDITNPNSLLSCQPATEAGSKYSRWCAPLHSVHISDNLYKKITSERRFTLEQSEIKELNKLATKGAAHEQEPAKSASPPGSRRVATRLWASLPFLSTWTSGSDEKKRNREAMQFMRGVMDECTHLGNFSVPYDTSLIIAVCAKHDAYVPRDDTCALEELWPGAEVRYIDAGHVSAYVLHQKLFRSCIVEAFERSKEKWRHPHQ